MEIHHASGPKVSPKVLLLLGILIEVILALALPSVYEWQPVFGVLLFALLVAMAAAATVHLLSSRKS